MTSSHAYKVKQVQCADVFILTDILYISVILQGDVLRLTSILGLID
jgi:hypothetical protein